MPAKSMKPSAFACLLIAMSMQAAQALTCNVSSAGLAFGVYNPASAANRNVNGSIRIACDGAISVKLSLDVGQGAGATYSGGRKMTRNGDTRTLTYNLYANSGRTIVLGDGTNGSAAPQISTSNKTYTQTVYGRIPGSQTTALSGSYKDTLVITIQY